MEMEQKGPNNKRQNSQLINLQHKEVEVLEVIVQKTSSVKRNARLYLMKFPIALPYNNVRTSNIIIISVYMKK